MCFPMIAIRDLHGTVTFRKLWDDGCRFECDALIGTRGNGLTRCRMSARGTAPDILQSFQLIDPTKR
jgi:hypothetical protein